MDTEGSRVEAEFVLREALQRQRVINAARSPSIRLGAGLILSALPMLPALVGMFIAVLTSTQDPLHYSFGPLFSICVCAAIAVGAAQRVDRRIDALIKLIDVRDQNGPNPQTDEHAA